MLSSLSIKISKNNIVPKNEPLSGNTGPGMGEHTALLNRGNTLVADNENSRIKPGPFHHFKTIPLHTPLLLQPKLTVNTPGDSYEQEADDVAGKVMRMTDSAAIQRKCAHCEEEEKEKKLQRKEISAITAGAQHQSHLTATAHTLSQSISSSVGRGQLLDNSTQSFMSERFGFDFGKVNIHTGEDAIRMSRDLNARAFTFGHDIYFNKGQYNPGTTEGKTLLAHELTHTLQQQPVIRRKPMPKDIYGRPLGFVGTPEQEAYDEETQNIKEHLLDVLRNGYPGTKGSSYLKKFIEEKYKPGTDEYWLANNLLQYGPEALWPASLFTELQQKSLKNSWNAAEGSLGNTAKNNRVNALYFAGQTDNRALVIAGVHGSELSGTEVVEILVERLKKGPRPYYSVIIVPSLFPDNADVAKSNPAKIETSENVGRYTKGTGPAALGKDPNRQFPAFGKAYDDTTKKDAQNKLIEPENIMFLELLERFKPARVASVHSNHDLEKAGIYADPRADSSGKALGFDSDKDLALAMADAAGTSGANVPGNKFKGGKSSNAIYPLDSPAAAAGKPQKRKTDEGNSFGGWGSTAVCDPSKAAANRPALRVITVEVQLAKRSGDVDKTEAAKRRKELEAHADALKEIFLGPNQVETAEDPCNPAPKP